MKRILFSTAKEKGHLTAFRFSLVSLLTATLLFVSCKKGSTIDPIPTPDPSYHLNVSTSSIESPATGTSSDVSIEANAAWKVVLPAGVDWLEVNKSAGDGNDAIKVKVTKENSTGAKRTAKITVSLVNGKAPSKEITVQQDFVVLTPVTVEWKKMLGGNGNDYGYSIIKTADGGYLVSGRTTSNNGDITSTKGGIDMWVVKLDAAGEIQWQKSYGGNADEYSVAAAATPDGGYVLTGYTLSNNNGDVGQNHGNTDFWVLKINGTGAIQWQKTLGGSGDDRPSAITVTTEGRIGVAGYTNSTNGDVGSNHGLEDMWVMLLDNGNGNFLWKKTFGGNGSENAKALAPAPNGGLYVGGVTSSNSNGDVGASKGNNDFWVLHLDRSLSIVWKNNFGGTNNEELNALAVSADGNMLVAAGSTKSNNTGDVGPTTGSEDMWVIRINAATGALLSQKVLGGNAIDVAKGVLIKPNGSIVVAGYTYSNNNGDVEANNGAGDYWIVGLNSSNSITWKKALGGDNEDLAWSVAEGANGFAVAGYTMSKNSGDVGANRGNSDIWVVKLKNE
jgi:hypothetical protein